MRAKTYGYKATRKRSSYEEDEICKRSDIGQPKSRIGKSKLDE
jgi:hypothetical protein